MPRKRILAVLAGLGVAGLVAASAAQLNVDADDLGAGVSVVASCLDATVPEGVTVAFTGIEYNDEIVNGGGDPDGGADVIGVTVTADPDFTDCVGQEMVVTLADGDGVALGDGTIVIPDADPDVPLTITAIAPGTYVSAADVEAVAVSITG
jgi:hypothetical protein